MSSGKAEELPFQIQPPIYNSTTLVGRGGYYYSGCGPDYSIERGADANSSLLFAWECGVLAGPSLKNGGGGPLKASVVIYAVLLAAYFL